MSRHAKWNGWEPRTQLLFGFPRTHRYRQLQISRKDDSEFFNRTFTKADFESCLDESFRKNGALLGIVFNRTEDDNLYFAASVGSPDKSSDEYVPLVLRLSKTGKVTISKDNQLDTSSDVAPEKTPDDDDSV